MSDIEDDNGKPDLRYNKTNIELRRAKVLELLSKGCNGADISRHLGTSRSLICLDIQFLKNQAQDSLREHIKETIPCEYQKSRVALQELIRKTNEILDANGNDPKIQLSIINTLVNLHAANMNLNSDGNIIQQAYERVKVLEEIQERRSEEAVFGEEDLTKEDTNPKPKPNPAKITTLDEMDTTPESTDADAETKETEEE